MLKVLYNDGDVEVLHLDKERWTLVKNSPKPTKVSVKYVFIITLYMLKVELVL